MIKLLVVALTLWERLSQRLSVSGWESLLTAVGTEVSLTSNVYFPRHLYLSEDKKTKLNTFWENGRTLYSN